MDSSGLIWLPVAIESASSAISEWLVAPVDLTIEELIISWDVPLITGTCTLTVEIGGTAVAGISIAVTGAQTRMTSRAASVVGTPTDQVAEGGAIEIAQTTTTTGGARLGGWLCCRPGRN